MSLESWSDERFTSTWSSHSSNYHSFLNVSERMLVVFSVIPSSLIDKLSQDLNWWLGSEVWLWHVQVINKDNTSHSEPWTKVILSSLIQLHVNNVLDLVAMSLSREPDLDHQEFVSGKLVLENILNVRCLTCSSWPDK